MTTVLDIDGDQKLLGIFQHLSVQDQIGDVWMLGSLELMIDGFFRREVKESRNGSHGGVCAICLDTIVLQETAMVKGCEHAYCVACILHWATYSQKPTCPQCKHPFEFLYIHRSLDGSIHDYMFEESVCLLLRAAWFKPLIVEDQEDLDDEEEYFYPYEVDEEDDPDDIYYLNSSNIRIGNRRWGPNGYIRAGHQEARPVYRLDAQNSGASSSRASRNSETKKDAKGHAPSAGASSSHDSRNSEAKKDTMGRRAKRTMKREAANKAAAAKHERHLARLGRN